MPRTWHLKGDLKRLLPAPDRHSRVVPSQPPSDASLNALLPKLNSAAAEVFPHRCAVTSPHLVHVAQLCSYTLLGNTDVICSFFVQQWSITGEDWAHWSGARPSMIASRVPPAPWSASQRSCRIFELRWPLEFSVVNHPVSGSSSNEESGR